MRTLTFALVSLAASTAVSAAEPVGDDAVRGAFVRLLEHEPVPLPRSSTRSALDERARSTEAWFNAVTRGDSAAVQRLATIDVLPAR